MFHCQLAHGSATKDVKDFSNVKELYGKIAEVFGMSVLEVSLTGHGYNYNALLRVHRCSLCSRGYSSTCIYALAKKMGELDIHNYVHSVIIIYHV